LRKVIAWCALTSADLLEKGIGQALSEVRQTTCRAGSAWAGAGKELARSLKKKGLPKQPFSFT